MIDVGILGYGEIGQALSEFYKDKPFNLKIKDKNSVEQLGELVILNVCIPYNNDFLDIVYEQIQTSKPIITIIHSTVLPGTTKRLQMLSPNKFVIHSPVRGIHPYLYDSLKRFVKYIGSDTEDGYQLAYAHLKFLGFKCERMKSSFATELSKLLCTTYYGVCIAWHDLVKKLCDRHSLEYVNVSTDWNVSYNEGYKELGMSHFTRPVLYPPEGKIGGHCVVPNAELLENLIDSSLIEEVLKFKK